MAHGRAATTYSVAEVGVATPARRPARANIASLIRVLANHCQATARNSRSESRVFHSHEMTTAEFYATVC